MQNATKQKQSELNCALEINRFLVHIFVKLSFKLYGQLKLYKCIIIAYQETAKLIFYKFIQTFGSYFCQT